MMNENPKRIYPLFLPLSLLLYMIFSAATCIASDHKDWPGFRGPQTDGTVELDSLFGRESAGAFHVAWRTMIGSGYSGVVISKGIAVALFSDGKNDYAGAFDSEHGKEVWRYKIGETYKGHDGSHDGPISTPVIWDGNVIGFGPWGHLFSLQLDTGKVNWAVHVSQTLGAEKPYYGFSSSPIVAGGVLIVEIGAGPNKAVAGFDPSTGEKKWTLGDDKINYQSPIRMAWKGREYVVATGDSKLYGLDPQKGEVVWEFVHGAQAGAIAAESIVPVPAGEERLWIKIKQDATTVLQLRQVDGELTMEPLWTAGVLRSTYSVPVYHNGFLYGYNGRVFSCVDAATGEIKWRSRAPGDGFLLLLGKNLVIQTKSGQLLIGPASPEGWKETARIQLFDDVSWTPSSFAEDAIFGRSLRELVRVEWKSSRIAAIEPEAARSETKATSRFTQFLQEVEKATNKNEVVKQFLASISQYPLIEWPDTVHFLYRGEAQDVAIAGDMIGYRREDAMHRVPGTNLFYYTVKLEPDATIHYRFQKDYEGYIRDPQNDRFLLDFRGQEISFFHMPGWISPDHLAEAPPEKQGKIESYEFDSAVKNGGKIQLSVYLPADYNTESDPLPAAYVFGGEAALKAGQMKNSLDNIIGRKVAPLIVVFLTKLEVTLQDPESAATVTSEMLVQDVVPYVESKHKTIRSASARACIGSGFAGFDAFYTALTHPETFAKLGGQSVFMLNYDQQLLMNEIRTAGEVPLQIYMDWGLYDLHATRENWSVRDRNRELVDFLRERGYRPAGTETHEGFHWGSWRNRTDRLFAVLFPLEEHDRNPQDPGSQVGSPE